MFQYGVLLGLVIILQIAAGVLVVVFREDFSDELESEMQKQVATEYTDDADDAITAAWNALQVEVTGTP